MAEIKNILWFSEVDKSNIPEVGGKGANLGELKKAEIPVPDGFIVTAAAYFLFLEKTGLETKIAEILKGLDRENSKDLQARAKKVQEEIKKAHILPELISEIIQNYRKLCQAITGSQNKDIFVAVRSSATAEDLPDASFAGQQATFLNIKGPENVVKAVQDCWASLFEARAIYYREEKGFDHFKVGIAVPVQEMVEADKAGVMFTIDPVKNDKTKIAIEAGFGLGEAVVSGSITPDRYLVNKETFEITDKEVNPQDFMIVKKDEKNEKITLDPQRAKEQKLTDKEIIELAKIGKKIEDHYKFPQDTEWTIYKDKIYMVQSRPVTTIKETPESQEKEAETLGAVEEGASEASVETSSKGIDINQAEVILKGAAASVGMASGPIKIIFSPDEIDKIKKGDVLVTVMTTPDYVPAMKRAAAIVTDKGGRTCHAAIVSRELGIPCVVGTKSATTTLKIVDVVTVDGSKGLVYKGAVKAQEPELGIQGPTAVQSAPVTATKIYVNLGEPELADKIARMNVDGVGLLRAEFIIAEQITEHPKKMLKESRGEEFTNKLAEGLETFARAFFPRLVVYRATDFKTNEYRNLPGGEEFEPEEGNPMIGYRGCFRYLKDPDVFKLELAAIKKIRENFSNLHLMIPFVRTLEEFAQVKKIVSDFGLSKTQDSDFKLWIMVEVPSSVVLIDKFCQMGIDGVSIGSNDLTQLTLGLDRDSDLVAEEFDERNEAVQILLKQTIETCKKYGVTCSICGQAPSVYPEICEKLVSYGITSLSVNPDVIDSTRRLVASIEEKLLLKELGEVKEELEEVEERLEEKEL